MNFLKKPYEFLHKNLIDFLIVMVFLEVFSLLWFFTHLIRSKKTITKKKLDKKTITIKKSIWFSLKNPYDFFKNSYGFLLKIHKDFSEIFRFFYKNHNKEKNR